MCPLFSVRVFHNKNGNFAENSPTRSPDARWSLISRSAAASMTILCTYMGTEEEKMECFRQESMEQWRPNKSCDMYRSTTEMLWMLMAGKWRSGNNIAIVVL